MTNLFRSPTLSSDTTSITSRHAPDNLLPSKISSTFSHSADAVFMWANNKPFLVQYQVPRSEGPIARFGDNDTIHGVAEAQGRIAVVISGADAKIDLVMVDVAQFSQDDPNSRTKIPLQREGDTSFPYCVCISPNGQLVAVGFGNNAVIVRLDAPEQTRCAWFTVRTLRESEQVRFQACSVSTNGESLVFSTHVQLKGGVRRGTRDNKVYTSFWPIKDYPEDFTPTQLATCQIPTVSAAYNLNTCVGPRSPGVSRDC
jgi:hypothetical protein